MKITYRIPHPKDQYAFVEVVHELERTVQQEEIREQYDALKSAFVDRQGVGVKKLAEILHEYCSTGSIVDGGDYDFSLNEKTLIGEVKKLIRTKKK